MINELQKYINNTEIDARKRIDEINAMPVLTRADFDKASEWLKTVVAVKKEFNNAQKEKIAPHKAEIDTIKEAFKKPLELLEEAEKIARAKLNVFLIAERQAEEARLEKEQANATKAAEKELRKLDRADAKADKYDEATAMAIRESNQDKREEIIKNLDKREEIQQGNASASVRMIWDFEIKDLKQVPVEYLQVNAQAVREAIKNGIHEIAGLNIYQKPTIAVK